MDKLSEEKNDKVDIFDVALFFLMWDTEGRFDRNKTFNYKGKEYNEGNVSLNIMLYMTQCMYLAKYGEPMFEEDFEAWEIGAICPQIYENYDSLLDIRDKLKRSKHD